jgi:hypothetical protein
MEIDHRAMEEFPMCDLAYINLLREKVRQLEAEQKRIATFGTTSSARFVPWVMPSRSEHRRDDTM